MTRLFGRREPGIMVLGSRLGQGGGGGGGGPATLQPYRGSKVEAPNTCHTPQYSYPWRCILPCLWYLYCHSCCCIETQWSHCSESLWVAFDLLRPCTALTIGLCLPGLYSECHHCGFIMRYYVYRRSCSCCCDEDAHCGIDHCV